jgi:hypothetical protein
VSGRFFLWLTVVGFIASAVLHLSTFFGRLPPPGDGLALALFAGAFVPLVVMLVRLRGAAPPRRGARMALLRAVAGVVPPGARMLVVGVVLYTLMNLVLSLMLTGGVTAEAVGDKRYLIEGGRREEVSHEVYDVYRRLTVRLLSGHLLLFYLVPLTYFRFVDRERHLLARILDTP